MEPWKKAVLAGSTGLAALCLLKGKSTGVFIFGGVALAMLASEYPEKLAEVRRKMPAYVDRGVTLVEIASRIGERLADLDGGGKRQWFDALLSS